MRRRKCDNPSPADGGQDCAGCPIEYETCNISPCQEVKKLSSWSSWLTVTNSTTRSGFTEKRFKFSCKAPVIDPNQIKIVVGKEEERFCYSDGSCTKNGNKNIVISYIIFFYKFFEFLQHVLKMKALGRIGRSGQSVIKNVGLVPKRQCGRVSAAMTVKGPTK